MKITLCGSSRFVDSWYEWNEKLSQAGHIVYGLAFQRNDVEREGRTELKRNLDLIHLAKIEESDAVFVLDVDITSPEMPNEGEDWVVPIYIGESTSREILWAKLRRKQIYYQSNPDDVDFLLGEGSPLFEG